MHPCHAYIKAYTAYHGVQKVPLEVAVALQWGIYILVGLTSQPGRERSQIADHCALALHELLLDPYPCALANSSTAYALSPSKTLG